ncbi:protein fuzzy homolog isoform X2 [Gigantopelta aegis]|uniref:protein fuzzy homolog isoform X2 n=1 Tax=Gigantopelta aegis TaxID=1735272 RepID=UPI001B88C89B|nr:protein fuzzy homolog isoform X2 [Gigantopelta aegis]
MRTRTGCLQMAVYLVCLTAAGGVPIFTRSKGELKPLPFPVIGSLNAVHMFASNHGVTLQSTTTKGSKIVWKVFHNSITLIVATRDDHSDDCHLAQLLDNIFQAMVLMYGADDVTNIKNIERFKREIKVCFQLVDTLLEDATLPTFSNLTNAVDMIAAPENAVLQNFLDAFTEAAGSQYGCLLVHGKVAVATKKWWLFSPTELILLSLLVPAMTRCTSRDLPVFLPQLSPTVPHRLMTFDLLKNIEICVITGPTPSLAELELEVNRFWKPGYESLKAVSQLHPRNFPTSLYLDDNILGFVVVNTELHRCLCSVHLASGQDTRQTEKSMSRERRREILRSWYKKVIGTYMSSSVEGSDTGPAEFCHTPLETYVVTDTHKCYALESGQHQIFVLYHISIPTFAMRSVTQKTLSYLTKDKQVNI